jgi:hypothetical protein
MEVKIPTVQELKLILNRLNREAYLRKELWEKDPIGKVGFDELLNIWKQRVQSDPVYRDLANELLDPIREQLTAPKTEVPTIAEMAKSVASSVKGWAASGFKVASSDLLEQRLSICGGCEFWDSAAFANTGRCNKCGCSTQAKLRIATEKCPAGKW